MQEGKRGKRPQRPIHTSHPRFPAHPSAGQSAPTNPTPTQNPSHRAFPSKCEPQPISTSSHQDTKKTAPLLMLSYSLKYSIKFRMSLLYLLLLQYIQVPVPSHHSVTLSHSSVTTQEGKRGGVPCRPANTNHARFPAHTHAPQSAPAMSTDYPNTLNHAFPLGASLNTGQKIYCAWAVPSTKSRVFMDGNSFFPPPVHVFGPFHGRDQEQLRKLAEW